jgi:hypothetical protein
MEDNLFQLFIGQGIFKIYKELKKSSTKGTDNPINK